MKNNDKINIGNIPSYVKNNRAGASIISKLVKEDKKPINLLSKLGEVKNISKFTKDKLGNNDTILKLFPEIELTIQIMVSSILSPNDMLDTELTYNNVNSKLPGVVTNSINTEVKKYLNQTYNLEDTLPIIIRESMFTKGAYVHAVIPESIVDEVINAQQYETASLEDIHKDMVKRNRGLIKVSNKKIKIKDKISLESKELNELIEITDNLSYLKLKEITINKINKEVGTSLGIESYTTTPDSLFKIFKKEDNNKFGEKENKYSMLTIKDEQHSMRNSVTQPLILKLPVESVIPVHVIGEPNNHLGYFILLDDNGVPIQPDIVVSKDNSKNKKLTGILKKANDALVGLNKKAPTLTELEDIYSEIIEDKIKSSLSSGTYKNIADVSELHDVYRTMFNRALKNQKTKLLFLPNTLVNYFAFRYRPNGTGESLLETISTISSMRAILLFTRLMTSIKNSVVNTNINVKLDDDDPDPEKTKEIIVSEVLKNRQLELPLGISNLDDLVDWSHSVGFSFNFKHISLPDMEINTEYNNNTIPTTDGELEKELRDQMIKAFGLTPEMVDTSKDVNFATSLVTNNILLAKRVQVLQNTFVKQLTTSIRNILKSDSVIRDTIREVIVDEMPNIKLMLRKIDKDLYTSIVKNKNEDTLIEYVLEHYIDTVTVTLPKPVVENKTNKNEAFTTYKDNLEEMIDLTITEDALPEELVGDMAQHLDSFRNIIYTTLLRKWCEENGYVTDLLDSVKLDKDGLPLVNTVGSFNNFKKDISTVLLSYLKANNKTTEQLNNKFAKLYDEDEGVNENDDAEVTDDNDNDNEIDNNTDVTDDNDNIDDGTEIEETE